MSDSDTESSKNWYLNSDTAPEESLPSPIDSQSIHENPNLHNMDASDSISSETAEPFSSESINPIPNVIPHKDHPLDQIISDLGSGIQTRSQTEEHSIISGQATANFCFYTNFLSVIEPKKADEALRDDDWVEAMQEELTEFERNKVWTLVPAPTSKTIIDTK